MDVNARRRERWAEVSTAANARRRERYRTRTRERQERDRQYRVEQGARLRERRIEEWITVHGPPPPCGCGCGQPVAFNRYGTPNRFLAGHWVPDQDHALTVEFAGDRIPTARAATALERLRVHHGWTIREMATRGGMCESTLWKILRDPTYAPRFGIDARILRAFLERLAGRVPLSDPERRRQARAYRETEPGAI